MEKCFFEAFEGMDRLGPGSKESTLKALSMYKMRNDNHSVLDIGCGNGIHTMILAENMKNSSILAIDNHPSFIDNLNEKAKELGFSNRVKGKCISMFEMHFEDNSFDLIWSEGAIYIAGFENGLRDWKRFLKDDGYLTCSEISWLVDSPSQEIYEFWHSEYPKMDTIENKIKQIENAGYTYKSHFISPVTDWTDNYYTPLENNLNIMREKYIDNEIAQQVIAILQKEIDLYKKYKDEYSYVFYIMTK